MKALHVRPTDYSAYGVHALCMCMCLYIHLTYMCIYIHISIRILVDYICAYIRWGERERDGVDEIRLG